MDFNQKKMKRVLILITTAILLHLGIHNVSVIKRIYFDIISLISPFIIGLCVAFFINLILVHLEKGWQYRYNIKKRKKHLAPSVRRAVCLSVSTALFLGIICAITFILIPQLKKASSNLAEQLPTYVGKIETWWNKQSSSLSEHGIIVPALNLNQGSIVSIINDFFAEKKIFVVDKTLKITFSVFDIIINAVLAFSFALYLLAQKELWKGRVKRFLFAFLPEKIVNKTLKIMSLSNTCFTNFVTGQLVAALVIGLMCFAGMLLFGFPNALVVSVIVCFTALIPIFGAWIGAIIGALIILFVSPIEALWFIVFLVILQQLEGNLIYPKIVGKSVGLPELLVIVVVAIGGSAFGIIGMMMAVPLSSVVYTLIQEYIEEKTSKKNSSSPENY